MIERNRHIEIMTIVENYFKSFEEGEIKNINEVIVLIVTENVLTLEEACHAGYALKLLYCRYQMGD